MYIFYLSSRLICVWYVEEYERKIIILCKREKWNLREIKIEGKASLVIEMQSTTWDYYNGQSDWNVRRKEGKKKKKHWTGVKEIKKENFLIHKKKEKFSIKNHQHVLNFNTNYVSIKKCILSCRKSRIK